MLVLRQIIIKFCRYQVITSTPQHLAETLIISTSHCFYAHPTSLKVNDVVIKVEFFFRKYCASLFFKSEQIDHKYVQNEGYYYELKLVL